VKLIFRLLAADMDRTGFSCGEPALDHYLKRQAGADMRRGFATVVTACAEDRPASIIGYYTLSAASIPLASLPDEIRGKMPRYAAVPAIRLGRLAVDSSQQRQHIGSLLVLDALRRSCRNELAWAVFLVEAKSDELARFYRKFLFRPFAENTLFCWMHRKQAEKLAGAGV
jgi:predicted N-acetyltransferase YhbS